MDLPPDPYLALGVPKDATPAAIKTAHRKLVLKFHPDKVTDPAAKEAAADQFHQAQTAYEILIDEDRRGRYDAQVRLANLRKEALERKGSGSIRGDVRSSSAPYRPSGESTTRSGYPTRSSERVAPQYEERRPSYAADYFDSKPKSSVRKEPEYERTSRRSGTDSKEKPRVSTRDSKTKESERERERRKEKSRKTEKETKREREQKYSPYVADDSESDSDEHLRRERRMREEDTQRRARDYYSKQRPDAADAYYDEHARKMASHTADARDYIQSRSRPREQERRPSPSRVPSSKDKVEYMKNRDGRSVPVQVRRSSARPKPSSRDSDFPHVSSRQEPERRRSDESMADHPRRPPTLTQHKSSPADIRIPESKMRSHSVQVETDSGPRVPPMKRSETAPYPATRRPENISPSKAHAQRPTIVTEGIATPALTPENATPPPHSKYSYGRQYADDVEYATPDGYKTEVREPVSGKATRPRLTRSPSPIKDIRDARDPRDIPSRDLPRDLPRDLRERERPNRTASARYPPSPSQAPQPSRTTSYVYNGPGHGVEAYDRGARPSFARGESSRLDIPREGGRLYGEVPTTKSSGSPRQKATQYPPTAPDDGIRYQKPVKLEDVRVQSGYTSKRPSANERPSFGRSGSGYYGSAGVRAN